MAANAILHCHFYEYSETSEDAYVRYLKKQGDWGTTHEENNIIKMLGIASIKKKLRQGKHICLVMRTEYLRAYKIVL